MREEPGSPMARPRAHLIGPLYPSGSEARGQEIRAHSERMSNVPLSAVHAG